MNVTEARQALASACNSVVGVAVRPHPIRNPITGDGWVTVTRAAPYTYGTLAVDFTIVVILGADPEAAELKLDQWALTLIDAVTQGVLCSNVLAEGTTLAVGQSQTPVHALTITATMEVE